MAHQNQTTNNAARKGLQTRVYRGESQELTHAEDFATNGDYLGRRPGDVSGRNHFDEEYFVDDKDQDAQPAQRRRA